MDSVFIIAFPFGVVVINPKFIQTKKLMSSSLLFLFFFYWQIEIKSHSLCKANYSVCIIKWSYGLEGRTHQ